MDRVAAEAGPFVHLSPPRRGMFESTARLWPMFAEGDVVVVSGGEPAPPGTRRVGLEDVVLEAGQFADTQGTFLVPLADFLWLPIFVSAVRSFEPQSPGPQRAQIGRLVVRRATWEAQAAELPLAPADLAAWARERGMPRQVFVRSPLERKPRFLDLESGVLLGAVARFIAPARDQAPGATVQFTEMLPEPDECWLEDARGHYTSELRMVVLDHAKPYPNRS